MRTWYPTPEEGTEASPVAFVGSASLPSRPTPSRRAPDSDCVSAVAASRRTHHTRLPPPRVAPHAPPVAPRHRYRRLRQSHVRAPNGLGRVPPHAAPRAPAALPTRRLTLATRRLSAQFAPSSARPRRRRRLWQPCTYAPTRPPPHAAATGQPRTRAIAVVGTAPATGACGSRALTISHHSTHHRRARAATVTGIAPASGACGSRAFALAPPRTLAAAMLPARFAASPL